MMSRMWADRNDGQNAVAQEMIVLEVDYAPCLRNRLGAIQGVCFTERWEVLNSTSGDAIYGN